ncbi:lipid II:glycine glycyltransferase FemX [Ancrocorticia sp.]|uniref:lipid II:glycine glycyltransferase FemX n=1 Tax=Ancrocorticia sp. TaxID=2593684 RepID=UPI003F93059E
MTTSRFVKMDDAAYMTAAAEAGIDLPLEQTPAWDPFDEAAAGREPWAKLVWLVDNQPRAFIALTKMEGRGFTYLWAKHGPNWVGSEPTYTEERTMRANLRSLVTKVAKSIAFVRLHSVHRSDDVEELLQSVTYDRTIILDLTKDADTLLAEMKKRGRRDVRKALRDETMVAADETDRALEVFPELYQLLVETGERDSFGISPRHVYEEMLSSLGPEHCRLFTVRREGRPLCWGIVTTTPTQATYYYAASSAEGRKALAPDLLVWSMTCMLRDRGLESFDMMGIDSERAPQLAGVRGFKTKFTDEIAEVPGAWDYPIHVLYYKGLVAALAAKRGIVAKIKG